MTMSNKTIKIIASPAFPLVALLFCVFIFIAASVEGPGVNIAYTVPDNYQGFLVVLYNCPDAHQSARMGSAVQIKFDTNGIACIPEEYDEIYNTSFHSIRSIQTHQGKTVRFEPELSMNSNGYALVDLQVFTRRYGSYNEQQKECVYSTLWIGETSTLFYITASNKYTLEEQAFFERVKLEERLADMCRE
jgi:hypothetical protein